MNEERSPEQSNLDLEVCNALMALRRAAQRARERAAQTGGTVVIFRDGKIVNEARQEQGKDG